MDYNYNNNNQYSTTSYGGQDGGGGGGFMPNSGSQDDSGGKRFGKESLRPVTIKQLNDAKQDHPDEELFKIDGEDVSQLTFVGQIRSVVSQPTYITYKLDDGTGTIEAKLWINTDATTTTNSQLAENSYARVWGRLKPFNGRSIFTALFVRPITDLNEIQYHLLDATVAHLHFTRGPLTDPKQDTNGTSGNAMQGVTNGDANGYKGRVLPAGLSGNAKKVYQVLHTTPQTNEGLHMQDVAARLNINMNDVGKAADELIGQGLIYTTVDDQTWAILEEL